MPFMWIQNLQAVPGVAKIKEGYNPATWMLDVTSSAQEGQLDVDFAEIYANSGLYRWVFRSILPHFQHSKSFFLEQKVRSWPIFLSFFRRNQELIKELSTPPPGSADLYFPTQFSQSFLTQCKACFWKQHWSYWRNSQYNAIRFFTTVVIGIMFGVIFWQKGDQM